jgi:hypothetical protein
LHACGHDDEAAAALRDGVAWVDAGSAQWTRDADRAAWRHGQPVHRRLLDAAQTRSR